MRKFILTLCACLLMMTTCASAEILKDDAGFSYWNSYNNLIFTQGSQVSGTYDLSSIHILADNNSRFEFNVIELSFIHRNGNIGSRHVINFREDYGTGKIYRNSRLLDGFDVSVGKTQREIYYKMKSVALSR